MELKSFTAQDEQGNVIPEATCYVYMRGTEELIDGLRRANGYPQTNPFSADRLGIVQFAAPNGLYDVRVTKGQRDYRHHVQFNDLSEYLAAAEGAVGRAELARDAAQLSAAIYPTASAGMAATPVDGYFNVVDPSAAGYLILFRNVAGLPVEVKRYPSSLAVDALNRVLQSTLNGQPGAEEPGVGLADEEGGEFLVITPTRIRTPALDAISDAVVTGIYDAEGAALLHADDRQFSVGPLTMGMTSLPGLYVTDEEDCILQDLSDPGEPPVAVEPTLMDPLAGGVHFASKLVTAPGAPLRLDVSSMIAPRQDALGVVASIASHTTSESQTSNRALVVQASKFGSAGRLKLRDPDNAMNHHTMEISFVEIPAGPFSGAAPNVLVIGDSICNRQGVQFLKDTLTEHGYSANFIGTMAGSALPDGPTSIDGPMGECRETYSTGNYTHATVSDLTLPVMPGSEAEYLALSKTPKRNHNPFIRAATPEDDPATIRNGYVLDFGYYQSRFSLPTPDIIVYALGMNDFLQTNTGDEVFGYVLDNENLMMRRIRAAWPNVKLLRCLPGLPYHRTRNPQWTERYIPLIRGVMSNLNALGEPRNILVPSWTFTNPETGYATGNHVVDPVTGITKAEITDITHPVGSNRRALFQGIAPYIAAATLNLI